ncbi:MAG: biotin--[acetyl-CoA-carboxylase] ligase [Acidimicrobiales bacterium]
MADAGARSPLAGTRFGDVRRFEAIDSTNAWLLDQARQGAPEGLVAVADHQMEGRGRLGRTWTAPPGTSLLVSVLLRPALDLERLHLATAVVALAAADACDQVAGVVPGLKWPNDLVVDGAKLAGILAEADLAGDEVRSVVVGVGLNVSWLGREGAAGLPPGAVALDQLVGFAVDRDQLLVAVLVALEGRLRSLSGPAGQATQAADYRRRCTTLGRLVRVELGDETFTGTVADVTPEGHLLVDIGTCLRRLTAGDVVHLRTV